MERLTPAQLELEILGQPTGSTIFCHNPKPLTCKTIRLGLNAFWDHTETLVHYQHDRVVAFPDGSLKLYPAGVYVVGARGFEVVQPKLFSKWLAERQDNTFGFSPTEVPIHRIESQYGKNYDYGAAAFYMSIYQLTGEWIGPTTTKAQDRWFCFELSAWYRGIDEYWCKVPDGKGSFK